jgi:predicted nucleotide-binding protein (sugar kinase/HSP70/actin superfamily)
MFNLLLNQVVALLLKEVPDKIEVDKIKDYLKQEKIQEIFGKVLSNTNLQEFEKNMKNEEKKRKKKKLVIYNLFLFKIKYLRK